MTENGTADGTSDPDLAELIDRWLDLHESTKARIMSILREGFDADRDY